MSNAKYPKPEEVTVSPEEAKRMMEDPSLIVIVAFETPWTGANESVVTYWRKDRGMLPPWINKAA